MSFARDAAETRGNRERKRESESKPPPGGRRNAACEAAPREARLEFWHQPKVDLRQKSLAGAEAIARLTYPDTGEPIPPRVLARLTDEQRLLLAERALEAALEDWADFDAAGFNLRLAVAMPTIALSRLPIRDWVEQRRPAASHWPGLSIAVSEDQIMRDIKRAPAIARDLAACGVSLAIHDFGAGYSSFASLRDLAAAEIKLHVGFVANCAADATNAAICQTAIDLAHRAGALAVADGVECAAELSALEIMGCDLGQGPLLGPAMPKERFIALLRARSAG